VDEEGVDGEDSGVAGNAEVVVVQHTQHDIKTRTCLNLYT
jgi:hypothetical protein